ncbi:MAG: hypothetical protein OHK0046_51190 [Anaerolineae bacterium]
MGAQKVFKVISGPLGVRKTPNGDRATTTLRTGDEITVDPDSGTEAGDYKWWKHDAGWSAEYSLVDGTRLLLDISDRDPNEPRQFRVIFSGLSIRDRPNGLKTRKKLTAGTVIKVDPKSVVEGKYIWWQHADGWSPERNVAGTEIFMREVFDVPRVGKDGKPLERIQLPADIKERGKVTMQVARPERICYAAGNRNSYLRNLKRGETVMVDMSTLQEIEGYYWLKHESGWTLWQDVYGQDVVLGEPGTIPGLVYIGPEGPRREELPGLGQMVTMLPADLKQVRYFQYFGNNVFAVAVAGSMYDYSQGLHGGLDFGIWTSDPTNIPVFAGVEGTFVKVEYSKDRRNDRVFVQNGDYTFIYQHVTNMRDLGKGTRITPETQLAVIHHESQGGWNHLHFEVRYLNDWIINPLWLMTPDVLDQIITAYPPDKPNINWKQLPTVYNFFYKTPDWDQWTTPLDQPILKLKGARIGPRTKKK